MQGLPARDGVRHGWFLPSATCSSSNPLCTWHLRVGSLRQDSQGPMNQRSIYEYDPSTWLRKPWMIHLQLIHLRLLHLQLIHLRPIHLISLCRWRVRHHSWRPRQARRRRRSLRAAWMHQELFLCELNVFNVLARNHVANWQMLSFCALFQTSIQTSFC